MKKLIYILLVLMANNKSFSQIEVNQIWFTDYDNFNKPERIQTKFFDTNGRITQDIRYGFPTCVFNFKSSILVSKKSYRNEEDYANNLVRYYWNYKYQKHDKSKITKVESNHTNCNYFYDNNNNLYKFEWLRLHDSTKATNLLKYNKHNEVIEQEYLGNWKDVISRQKDTVTTLHYLFNYPKPNDTTVSVLKEVFKKNKIIYSQNIDGEVKTTKRYMYAIKRDIKQQLDAVYTKMKRNNDLKEFITELAYTNNGLLQNIQKFEKIKNNWTLKIRTIFEIKGKTLNFNQKEKEKINSFLITECKGWL
ncbi:hypothetical protein [Flavivirga rizhaonensis]|uniref:Uncharacterized protein n=1 Tax=Flavivirga rizhaonensis TaxID=2559571 RepID=A0A4S1E005_9FLAO|nr:hypothetical protein [Flavivirga rizhaonensis]TGV03603.1 hypothetical protein EM932_06140 [Flavivirga rizhaonensis]